MGDWQVGRILKEKVFAFLEWQLEACCHTAHSIGYKYL